MKPLPLCPPKKVQFAVSLHPAPTGPCSAECQRAPGAHLRNRAQISKYWTGNGWGCPPTLSQIRKISSFTRFYCGQSCKKLSSTSARPLRASCSEFLGKAGLFSLPWVTHALPLTGKVGARAFPTLGSRKTCENIQQKHLTQVDADNPQGGSSAPFCWGSAVAVVSSGRKKWEMLLWEKILILGLCPSWVESSRKEGKEDLGNCVWINFLTLQSFMEESDY